MKLDACWPHYNLSIHNHQDSSDANFYYRHHLKIHKHAPGECWINPFPGNEIHNWYDEHQLGLHSCSFSKVDLQLSTASYGLVAYLDHQTSDCWQCKHLQLTSLVPTYGTIKILMMQMFTIGHHLPRHFINHEHAPGEFWINQLHENEIHNDLMNTAGTAWFWFPKIDLKLSTS